MRGQGASRRPGRPAGRTGDETRERIVRAAVESFAKRGLAGTSVRDIATRARIRVSTLYHYFPSKMELYREVQGRVHDGVRAIVLEQLGRGLPLDELTREVVGRVFDFFLANRTFLQLGCRTAVEPTLADDGDSQLRERWLGLVEGMLTPAAERGDVKAIDPVHLMVTIDALVHWHIVNEPLYKRLLGRGFDDPDVVGRTREHVIKVALRTLGLE